MWCLQQVSTLLLLGALLAVGVQGQTIAEFSVPTLGAGPSSIVAGPDGNLWFTEPWANKIGRITTSGVITEFTLPKDHGKPKGIAAGPDGNIWFIQGIHGFGPTPGSIGRITPTGDITLLNLPTSNGGFEGIAAGPDGNLWVTEYWDNRIGRITTTGDIAEFTVPGVHGWPVGIAAGPDGNLWVTLGCNGMVPETGSIGRITPTGVATLFIAPTANGGYGDIAAGPDGNMWFSECWDNRIGRITTTGVITEFTIPAESGGIAAGPDGAVWFTEGGSKIGRITAEGTLTEFPVPTPGSWPSGITVGPDGNLWFTESVGNKIGRLSLEGAAGACVADPTTLCLTGSRFQAQANWTTPDGRTGIGQAVSLTANTGYFWFFSSDNVEVMVKVVDGCALNSYYWVFVGGLTDIHVAVTVTDTATGAVRTYTNPQKVAFQSIQDTTTFRGP